MTIPKLGKGTKFSIAKAALIWWFEEKSDNMSFIMYDDLTEIHRIVEIAGAKHCSFFTSSQVSSRLYNSTLWDKDTIPGMFAGIQGHGKACAYQPSEKGKKWYREYSKSTGN